MYYVQTDGGKGVGNMPFCLCTLWMSSNDFIKVLSSAALLLAVHCLHASCCGYTVSRNSFHCAQKLLLLLFR